MKQLIIDLGKDSPVVLCPEDMSDALAVELVQTLYLFDFPDDNDWRAEWLLRNSRTKTFTLKQRKVIYDLAFKYQLIS